MASHSLFDAACTHVPAKWAWFPRHLRECVGVDRGPVQRTPRFRDLIPVRRFLFSMLRWQTHHDFGEDLWKMSNALASRLTSLYLHVHVNMYNSKWMRVIRDEGTFSPPPALQLARAGEVNLALVHTWYIHVLPVVSQGTCILPVLLGSQNTFSTVSRARLLQWILSICHDSWTKKCWSKITGFKGSSKPLLSLHGWRHTVHRNDGRQGAWWIKMWQINKMHYIAKTIPSVMCMVL